jgi:hypothetical protein
MKEVISKAVPNNLPQTDINRYWSKVAITANPEKCWEWLGGKRRRGYGRFSYKHADFISTRIAYFLHNKIDPIGKAVLHKCDNPSCVNPNHLFLGTNKENTYDMMEKKRGIQPVGIRHGQAKLTDEKVIEIRKKYLNGICNKELSKEYNVSRSAITKIINNKTWTHV